MKKFSRFMQIASMVIGILLIIGCSIFAIAQNMSINNALGLGLGFVLAILGWTYSKMPGWLKIITKISVCLVLVLVILTVSLMIKYGTKNTATFDEDIVIVLGSGVIGTEPGPMLKDRLEAAIDYIDQNVYCVAILSGGQGYGEDISEAEAMKDYLVSKGLNKYRAILEKESTNTYENIANAKARLDDLFAGEEYTVTLLTTDFHMYRAVNIAKDMGLDVTTYNAPIKWYLRPGSTLREIISIVKYWYWSTFKN